MQRQQKKRAQLYARFAEMPRRPLSNSYTLASYEAAARAISMEAIDVLQQKDGLESDAWWYRTGVRRPPRAAPSKRMERLGRIIKRADQFLESLRIKTADIQQILRDKDSLLSALYVNSEDACDGVGSDSKSWEIFEALASVEPGDEDAVVNAIRTVSLSTEIAERIDSTVEIRRRAVEAADYINRTEIDPSGICREPKGNQNDAPLNDWIASTMRRYTIITGKPVRTSVWKAGSELEGIASGPLIRFLKVTGQPLYTTAGAGRERHRTKRHRRVLESEDALRARIRRLAKA